MFCGITLAEIDDYEDMSAEEWNTFLTKKYKVDETHILPTEDEIRNAIVKDSAHNVDWDYADYGCEHPGPIDPDLITITKKPMIVFIPRNCYCCT